MQFINKHEVAIDEPLSFATVMKLCKEGSKLISANNQLTFNLAGVAAEDNSGLALLSSWTRLAERQNKKIKFVNLPKQLLAIAKLSGLDKILPINLIVIH